MTTYYAVIDTNVLVSAVLKADSVPGRLMELVFDGPIAPVLDRGILGEYRAVLSRPKFSLTPEIVSDILARFEEKGLFVDAEPSELELPDPKDRVFYEVVLEKRKEGDAYLVTGNMKHFPAEPFIVTPRQMLELVLSDV
ncbi:MAG: putative toxin-antitoxin system toxin component, PIN family [Clostridia bacterium]|nr:putative toxin-antitoxin system toxin component, PIN family [Clostridia bacterium]